jgi:protein transport protein SEC13
MSSKKIELDHKDMVHDSAIDYYGKRLATASSDSTVKITSIGGASAPSQLLATLTGHYGPVWRVGWAHPKYGSILASCGYDGRVIVWKESTTGQWSQAHVFGNHKSSVNSIAWAPYELGLSLACGSSDGTISVMSMRPDGGWDAATIERAHPVGVTAVSWAPAAALGSMVGSDQLVHKLVSGGFDSVVKVWEFVNGVWKLESALVSDMHTECVRDVSWAPVLGLAKSTIASASQDGKVVIWTKGKGGGDKWEGKVMRDFEAPVWRVSWSLTGDMLSVAAGEGDITLWKGASDGQWESLWTKGSDEPQEQETEQAAAEVAAQ